METNDRTSELIEATITDIHRGYVQGEFTSCAVVEMYLKRIDSLDGRLKSILTVNPSARQQAVKLDERFEDEGLTGLLHGIPIVLKDNINTASMPTTAGSPVLATSRPTEDAFIVRRLLREGGIILAKTNLGEFARGAESTLGGHPRNPYSLNRTTNGSSSGTAAAVAANLSLLGMGTDTGGSVRNPAASTNLVGLRPTTGTLSRGGIVPVSPTLDTPGPIARTVEDTARLFRSLTGFDERDPPTARGSVALEPEELIRHDLTIHRRPVRLGVLRSLVSTDAEPGGGSKTRSVEHVFDRALSQLERAGVDIVDPISLPDEARGARDAVLDITKYEFQPAIDSYLNELGDDRPVDTLADIADFGHDYPNSLVKARVEGSLSIDRSDPDVKNRYLTHLESRTKIRDVLMATLVSNELAGFVYPTHAQPPVRRGEKQEGTNTRLSPMADLPAVTVPAGFTVEEELPVGFEIMGAPFDESTLLSIGAFFERISGHRRAPTDFNG